MGCSVKYIRVHGVGPFRVVWGRSLVGAASACSALGDQAGIVAEPVERQIKRLVGEEVFDRVALNHGGNRPRRRRRFRGCDCSRQWSSDSRNKTIMPAWALNCFTSGIKRSHSIGGDVAALNLDDGSFFLRSLPHTERVKLDHAINSAIGAFIAGVVIHPVRADGAADPLLEFKLVVSSECARLSDRCWQTEDFDILGRESRNVVQDPFAYQPG